MLERLTKEKVVAVILGATVFAGTWLHPESVIAQEISNDPTAPVADDYTRRILLACLPENHPIDISFFGYRAFDGEDLQDFDGSFGIVVWSSETNQSVTATIGSVNPNPNIIARMQGNTGNLADFNTNGRVLFRPQDSSSFRIGIRAEVFTGTQTAISLAARCYTTPQ